MIPLKSLSEKKILLIDDENEILDLLETVLRKEGFQQVEKARTGQEGIEKARAWQPDAVVLDIMLPDLEGFEVCRQMRAFTYAPILFLSARSDDVDKLLGLGIGGDDYITKPFSPKEVAFRLKAQFRRGDYPSPQTPNSRTPSSPQLAAESKRSSQEPVYSFGDIRLDTISGEVTRASTPLTLTAKEYQLLVYLARNPNRILSKQKICDEVWGEPYIGLDNTIMVHIHHLRDKIEPDPTNPTYILTVKGLGYKLNTRGN